MFYYWWEKVVGGDDFGDLIVLVDVFGDVGIGVFDLDFVVGGGDDFECVENGYVRMDQCGVCVVEVGEGDFMDEVFKDWCVDQKLVFL